MSQELIDANHDLALLQKEGYSIEILSGHLLVHGVPYVNSRKEICWGVLIAPLDLAGHTTQRPSDHVCHFQGEHPCNKDGVVLSAIQHQEYSPAQKLAANISVDHSFSSKPPDGYADYYDKMTSYIKIITHPARAIDPSVTAKKNAINPPATIDSPFMYEDTNTSRAKIGHLSDKFLNMTIAIVGLGGTGSYVLDFISKTKVKAIHLFDGDTLQNHNAFRMPGAVPTDILNDNPKKVAYLKDTYTNIKRDIYAYQHNITPETLTTIVEIPPDFVFVCIDQGEIKRDIICTLMDSKIPFIDVGIGINNNNNQDLLASARVTMGDADKQDHFANRISFANSKAGDYADPNIQIAEINAINAALAVIRWKKQVGFYHNQSKEYHSIYDSSRNKIINDEVVA